MANGTWLAWAAPVKPEDDEASATWASRPTPLLVRAVQPVVRVMARLHAVRFDGLANLPSGPALLVGNHGMLGYESPLFFEHILAAHGRLPVGLADRFFFKIPVVRELLVRLGGTYGSVANGLAELARGKLVVCYPGGARETLKQPSDKYRLLWQQSVGFVRLAMAAGVPIVPFVAAGVDDAFTVVGRLHGTGELLLGHDKYDLPLVWGRRGLLPRRVPFWFRIGEPVLPPAGVGADDVAAVEELHGRVWSQTQTMLDTLVAEWMGRSV